jgi:hypothetical protein
MFLIQILVRGKNLGRSLEFHSLFSDLLLTYALVSCFNYSSTDCIGQPSVPLEVKVLTALRILGNGVSSSVASELSGVLSESSTSAFLLSGEAREWWAVYSIYLIENFRRAGNRTQYLLHGR